MTDQASELARDARALPHGCAEVAALSGSQEMHILCVTPWLPSKRGEQAGNFVFDSIESLVSLGHRVSVLLTEPWRPAGAGLLKPEWRHRPIDASAFGDVFELEIAHYPSLPRNVFRPLLNALHDRSVGDALRRLVGSDKPDVIHAHTEALAPIVSRVGAEYRVPTVVTLHGINTARRLRTPSQLAYIGRGLAEADRVALVGAPLVPHFSPIAARTDHFRIVHNGFRPPPDGIVPLKPEAAAIRRFISVSNLHEGKGIDLTLRALALLSARGFDDWTYTIVGAGEQLESLEALTGQLSLNSKVKFAGAWPHGRIYEQLRKADAFVLPSYREAFGIAYLEAMAAGLLTIGVSGQGPSAFISSGETGFLVKPRDVDDLAAILHTIVTSPRQARSIAAAGQKLVGSEFTWQRHGKKLAQVFAEVVKQ